MLHREFRIRVFFIGGAINYESPQFGRKDFWEVRDIEVPSIFGKPYGVIISIHHHSLRVLTKIMFVYSM